MYTSVYTFIDGYAQNTYTLKCHASLTGPESIKPRLSLLRVRDWHRTASLDLISA